MCGRPLPYVRPSAPARIRWTGTGRQPFNKDTGTGPEPEQIQSSTGTGTRTKISSSDDIDNNPLPPLANNEVKTLRFTTLLGDATPTQSV